MKRIALYLLVAGTAGWLIGATGAEAGWFGTGKDKDEGAGDPAPRYDNYPTLSFHVGTLTRNGYSGWKLGDLDVQFRSDCEISSQGQEGGSLAEGRQAIVSGARVGGTILALRITVLKPNWDMGPANMDQDVTWSDSDPTVGVGQGPY